MNAFQHLKLRLLTMPVESFIVEAAEEAIPVIEDMNAEQLERGFRADNSEITPKYRNPLYSARKRARNSKPSQDTPDLKLSGDFHRSITAKVTGVGIEITATDQKTEMLLGKYGDEIIGLSEENINELQDGYLKPTVLDSILKHIQR